MRASAVQPRPRTILVIEDHDAFRHFVVDVLEGAGYAVQQAPDGETGLRQFRGHVPDLVLTDIVMPYIEGIEIIRTIAASEHRRPVVAMSGGVPPERGKDYLKMALLLGAGAVLQKPFTPQQVLQTIAELLEACECSGRPPLI